MFKERGTIKMKLMFLAVCLLLSGCNIPVLFWEEEARKVVDDVVDEEEQLEEWQHQRELRRLKHLEKDHAYHHGCR